MTIEGRILCMDVGDRRIGVAISDGLLITAQPYKVLDRKKGDRTVFDQLEGIIEDYEIKAVLFGLPKNLDNTLGAQTEKTLEFMRKFSGRFREMPLFDWDERFSSLEAMRALDEGEVKWRRKKDVVDKVAAALILQGFLDRLKDPVFHPAPAFIEKKAGQKTDNHGISKRTVRKT